MVKNVTVSDLAFLSSECGFLMLWVYGILFFSDLVDFGVFCGWNRGW